MLAHKIIDSLSEYDHSVKEPLTTLLKEFIGRAHKFRFERDEIPEMLDEEIKEYMLNFGLPYPLIYVEFDNVAAVLTEPRHPIDTYVKYIMYIFMIKSGEMRFYPNKGEVLYIDYKGNIRKGLPNGKVPPSLDPVPNFFLAAEYGAIQALTGTIFSIIAALSCDNVTTEDVPPPEKLQRKRLKKGRTPMFTYKQLVLKSRQGKGQVRGPLEGKRKSPRLHLRRGHIRKLQSGKRVWIAPMAVGAKDRGAVKKEYVIK